MTEYAKRDPQQLDAVGGHYSRHIAAMTEERLHSKHAIAAELAWRDYQLAECTKERDVALRDLAHDREFHNKLDAECVKERNEARAEVEQLNGRRREMRELLRRIVKYAREDGATTPGNTRLARLTERVADYLKRTGEPNDILREEG